MNTATQRSKILAYCKEHGSITVRDACVKLHINSPTKRFSELKFAGYEVKTVDEIKEKDDGSTVRYNRYYINAPRGFDINEGDRVKFVPCSIPSDSYSEKEKEIASVVGTVFYINYAHKYFAAEYKSGETKHKESFKFADLGQAVKVCG